jgi:hypothetical protein
MEEPMAKELPVFSEEDHIYADFAVGTLIDALLDATDVRPFLDPCLGIGGDSLCVINEAQLPEDVLGHLKLDFIPGLTTQMPAEAFIDLGVELQAALGGAFLNARDIVRNGVNENNEFGFDLCMTVVEDSLRAHFANRH